MANRTINFFTRRKYSLSPYLNNLTNGNPKLGLTSPILISKRTTTILCVRKNGVVIMAGDGQVSQGSSVVKGNARKVRRIGDDILVGFAGSTADAMALLERLERKLEEHPGQLFRACVELAKAWRSEKYLRRLEATIIVADSHQSLELTGNGDVLEPEPMKGGDLLGVGSGGNYAIAAARALIDRPDVDAEEIVREAMKIASDLCVYTNHNYIIESIGKKTVAVAVTAVEDSSSSSSAETAPGVQINSSA